MDFYIQGQVSPLMSKSLWLHFSCGKGSAALGEGLAQGNTLSQRMLSCTKAET